MTLLILKRTDFVWWGLAAVLGLASITFPGLLNLETTHGTRLIIAHVGLLLSGAVIGFVKPTRVWRWGIGSILLFPVAEGVTIAVALPVSFVQSLPYLLVKIPIYALQALLALLGAYLGAFSRQGVLSVRLSALAPERCYLFSKISAETSR